MCACETCLSHLETYIPFLEKRERYSWWITAGGWWGLALQSEVDQMLNQTMNLYLRFVFVFFTYAYYWLWGRHNAAHALMPTLTRRQRTGVTAFELSTWHLWWSHSRLVIRHYVCMSQLITAVTSFQRHRLFSFFSNDPDNLGKKGAGIFFFFLMSWVPGVISENLMAFLLKLNNEQVFLYNKVAWRLKDLNIIYFKFNILSTSLC